MRAALFLFTLVSAALAAEPFAGTWIIDAERSSFTGVKPQAMTIRLTVTGDTLQYSDEGTDGGGTHYQNAPYAMVLDGKPYPAIYPALMAARRRTAPNTIETILTNKSDGAEAHRQIYTLSEDGQTLTITSSGNLPGGRTYKNVIVLARR